MGKLRQKEREVKDLQQALAGKNRQIALANKQIIDQNITIEDLTAEVQALKVPKESIE